ncbi:probable E3 ubiquitin-protein ligase RHG1A isoform X2 [Cornus florida]|uniref:probable E3 ubiquitin-protein ligase RHG1A isoform X2 n=1 Tax=Cornus florida TaxID=4283 RepID=UPI002899AA43|nr:probable E3 ubiquitin-protein ligase RHG1A isoform X2 [Cornus florida]
MQGQRSSMGSLPETLRFDHGSTSSNAGVDQQICWNNTQNSSNNCQPDYVISPSDPSITYLNSMSQEGQNTSGWNLGEPSSSGAQNQVSLSEGKTEHGWSSSMSAFTGPGPILEEQLYEPANILSLNNVNVNLSSNQIANGSLFMQSSNSSAIPQDLNINAGFVDRGVHDCQVTECPNMYKSGGSENAQFSLASSSSNPFGMPSGSNGFLVEENDGRRDFSMEGRRLSCKRKAFDGNVGQSSMSGSSRYTQYPESNAWQAVPAHYNACSSLGISTPSPSEHNLGVSASEQVNARIGLGLGGASLECPLALNVVGSAERTRRNFRVRINPSHQQESQSANVISAGSVVGHSSFSSPHQPSRFLPLENSLDLGSAPAADNASPQRQSVAVQVPALPRNLQLSRWTGGSSSRPGNISGSVIGGEVDFAPHGESNSISTPRNIPEHPLFVAADEFRNSVQNPTNWSLPGGNMSIAANVASPSRTGSNSAALPSSAPNWVHNRNPPQYARRLSELVRRSLLSSEAGGRSNNNSPLHPGPSSSQEVGLSSGTGNHGHHLSRTRSAMLLERQLDVTSGIPYSLRTLAAASEGRSRLVSEDLKTKKTIGGVLRKGWSLLLPANYCFDSSTFHLFFSLPVALPP